MDNTSEAWALSEVMNDGSGSAFMLLSSRRCCRRMSYRCRSSPPAILQWRGVHDGEDMGTMYQTREVVVRFLTVDHFFVLVTRLEEALDGAPGRPLLDGLLQIDKFFSVEETFLTVDGYVELFPELLPVQSLTIERGNVQLENLEGTLTIGGRVHVPGVRGVSVE